MPAERRYIIFRPLEYIEAIRTHRHRLGQPFPPGSEVRYTLSETDGWISIGLEFGGDEGGTTVRIRHEELLAALIL